MLRRGGKSQEVVCPHRPCQATKRHRQAAKETNDSLPYEFLTTWLQDWGTRERCELERPSALDRHR